VADQGKGLVLVVEDERPIADLVRMYLSRDGFGVHVEHDGTGGLAAARRVRPVACVLDIALPGMDGTEVVRRLREAGDWTPVIFLTARDDEVDRIVGLELGADDYVTKPFSPRELVARLHAILRRAAPTPGEPVIEADGLEVDLGARLVRRDGDEVHLTPIEFDLLRTLARNRGRLLTHRALLQEVWGPGYADDVATLRTNIARLRRKIEPEGAPRYIRTDPGVGYRFSA
jgi:DNA-binding response OmpR family regulator